MRLHIDKCLELGLPTPKGFDTEDTYILNAIANGHKLNTRKCRYIGIHNLHSLAARLKRKRFNFTLEHGRVTCPFTNELPTAPVDIVYMTDEQREQYKETKSGGDAA